MDRQILGVGDIAKSLGVRPNQVTALFYERKLRDDLCPIVSGCRIIPESYLPVIAMELRRKGIQVSDSCTSTRLETTESDGESGGTE